MLVVDVCGVGFVVPDVGACVCGVECVVQFCDVVGGFVGFVGLGDLVELVRGDHVVSVLVIVLIGGAKK